MFVLPAHKIMYSNMMVHARWDVLLFVIHANIFVASNASLDII